MSVVLVRLFKAVLTKVSFAECLFPERLFLKLSPTELPEPCFLAQVDHLTAALATNELLLHPYRFALARCTFPYFSRTNIHHQHGAYRQYQPSFCFHSFALHFNGLNTLFLLLNKPV